MSRVTRLLALWLGEPARAPEDVTAISVVVSLYREWRIAGRELERLARALTRRHFHEGLRALEHGCTAVRIAGGLVEIVERDRSGEIAVTEWLRKELLAEIKPWLEAARSELPAAATALSGFVSDPALHDEVAAALRQLDEELAGEQAPSKRSAGS